MSCPPADQILAFVDGAPGDGARIHIERCVRCQATVARVRGLAALPVGAPGEIPPSCPSSGAWEAFIRGEGIPGPLIDHLASCERCVLWVAALQDLGREQAATPRKARPRILARRPHSPWPVLASLAAMAVIAVTVGWFVMKSKRVDQVAPTARRTESQAPAEPALREPGGPTIPGAKPRASGAATGEERLRIEAELREEVDRVRKQLQLAEEKPRPVEVPAPVPEKSPSPPTPTITAAVVVVETRGEVTVVRSGGRQAARTGDAILPGDGAGTEGPKGLAILAFPDGTKLELRGDTLIREIHDEEAGQGKRFAITRGAVTAQVAKQPPDRPLVIGTPQGEARVLGTTLRLVVDSDPAGSTRLMVREGRVQLKRTADGKSVEVAGGHHATAGAGVDLVARPERRIWLNDFDTAAGVGLGEIVRLAERPRDVTAVASIPKTGPITYAEEKIRIEGDLLADGSMKSLFAIPEDAEFRIRIRSEKRGTFEMQLVVDRFAEKQSFEARDRVPVGPEWKEVVLHPEDFFLWQDKSAMKAGTTIPLLNLYGFGSGRLFVDRIEVVSFR